MEIDLIRRLLLTVLMIAMPLVAAAEELILPVFALNAQSRDGSRWSTEIYLVNPTGMPVQVAIAGLLPGRVKRPTPCGQFMSQTHVVPSRSAVLWTASGLATDLGCADEVLGALKLLADGPVLVTGRMVRHTDGGDSTPAGVLSGGGHRISALSIADLPGPTNLLLPALLWHRNPCGEPAFSTDLGLANPGSDPVTVTIDLPKEGRRSIKIGRRTVALPHQFVVEPESWTQVSLSPIGRSDEICLEPETFDLDVLIDGPLAVYASVVDESSGDSRVVEAVDLNAH